LKRSSQHAKRYNLHKPLGSLRGEHPQRDHPPELVQVPLVRDTGESEARQLTASTFKARWNRADGAGPRSTLKGLMTSDSQAEG